MTTPHLNGVMRQNPMSQPRYVESAVSLQRCVIQKHCVVVATSVLIPHKTTKANRCLISSY